MGDDRVIIVKFRAMAAQTDRCEQLSRLMGDEFAEVEPLFPDDEEPELASLFQVRLRRADRLTALVDDLAATEDVEYAHAPAERAPKRGRKGPRRVKRD